MNQHDILALDLLSEEVMFTFSSLRPRVAKLILGSLMVEKDPGNSITLLGESLSVRFLIQFFACTSKTCLFLSSFK